MKNIETKSDKKKGYVEGFFLCLLPLGKLILWHHLLLTSFSQSQIQALKLAVLLVHALNLTNHWSMDQLVPVTRKTKRQNIRVSFCVKHKGKIKQIYFSLTSSADARSFGSKARRRSRRRRAKGSALGNLWEKGTGCFFLMLLRYLLAFSFLICRIPRLQSSLQGLSYTQMMEHIKFATENMNRCFEWLTLDIDSGGGVPRKSVIRSNWCTTFFPGNKGLPKSISANMQPTLQISMAGVYWNITRVDLARDGWSYQHYRTTQQYSTK